MAHARMRGLSSTYRDGRAAWAALAGGAKFEVESANHSPGDDFTLAQDSDWLSVLHRFPGRLTLLLNQAPSEVPAPFDVDHLGCLPEVFRSLLPELACKDGPNNNQKSSDYAQGLVAPVIVAIVVTVLAIATLATTACCVCCCTCTCCSLCGDKPLSPALGGKVDIPMMTQRELIGFEGRGMGVGTCAAARCTQLVCVAAVAVMISLAMVPLAGLYPATVTATAALGNVTGSLGPVLDAARNGRAQATQASESALAAASLLQLSRPDIAQLCRDGSALALAAVETAVAATGNASTGALSWATGLDRERKSLPGKSLVAQAGFEVLFTLLCVVALLSVLVPTRRCCPCCVRAGFASVNLLALPVVLSCLSLCLVAGMLLSDACAAPGTYLTVLLADAEAARPDLLRGPPLLSGGPSHGAWPAQPLDQGAPSPATVVVTTSAYLFASRATAASLDVSGGPAAAVTCQALLDAGDDEGAPPASTMPGVLRAALPDASLAAARLLDANASVWAASPGSDAARLIATAAAASVRLNGTISDAAGSPALTCTGSRALVAAALRPLCVDVVGGVLAPVALCLLALLSLLLLLVWPCAALSCGRHPTEAKAAIVAALQRYGGGRLPQAEGARGIPRPAFLRPRPDGALPPPPAAPRPDIWEEEAAPRPGPGGAAPPGIRAPSPAPSEGSSVASGVPRFPDIFDEEAERRGAPAEQAGPGAGAAAAGAAAASPLASAAAMLRLDELRRQEQRRHAGAGPAPPPSVPIGERVALASGHAASGSGHRTGYVPNPLRTNYGSAGQLPAGALVRYGRSSEEAKEQEPAAAPAAAAPAATIASRFRLWGGRGSAAAPAPAPAAVAAPAASAPHAPSAPASDDGMDSDEDVPPPPDGPPPPSARPAALMRLPGDPMGGPQLVPEFSAGALEPPGGSMTLNSADGGRDRSHFQEL